MAEPAPAAGPGERRFACAGCGALQVFRPGARVLYCEFCGHETPIPEHADAVIREYPLGEALAALADAAPASATASRCPSCAAKFSFDPSQHAGECPFCGTPIVETPDAGGTRRIHPRSLLPFRLDDRAAADAFRQWLGRLRFTPGRLTRFARLEGTLRGVYLPYWTYDARTTTRYRGERGTVYYVTVPVTSVRDGKRVTRMVRQPRVRWTPVSGTVHRNFDDVLVGASRSLPRKLTDRLAPWDMSALVPYDERYLSGFRSEVYQVDLEQGFEVAREVMAGVIRRDVARDIGGDHQGIHALETSHHDVTWKHLLLPVWTASFTWRRKRYRFAVNGQTGAVVGERPWSVTKIVLTVLAALALLGALLLFAQRQGLLNG